ncbi:MAG: hypothetical protein QW265_04865 [Candidatus Bathyarchaeia archaeon]
MLTSRNVEIAKHHHIPTPEALKFANIKVGFGIGDLDITALDEPKVLFKGDYENEKPLLFRLLEEEAQIIVGDWSLSDWFPYFWYLFGDSKIKINKHIPLRITVDGRLGDTDLDFFELKLQDLRVRYLLGDLNIWLPQLGSIFGLIEFTLGDIIIVVPRGLGARVRLGTTVFGKRHVEEDVFVKNGSEYVSKDFEEAKNRLEIKIDFHLGDLRIKSA